MRLVAVAAAGRTVGAMNVTTATQVLGLPPRAPDRDDLVSAWRRFARTHHPDRCPGDPGAARRFSAGREAYEALIARAPERRAPVLRGAAAARAVPYAPGPLSVREWRA